MGLGSELDSWHGPLFGEKFSINGIGGGYAFAFLCLCRNRVGLMASHRGGKYTPKMGGDGTGGVQELGGGVAGLLSFREGRE